MNRGSAKQRSIENTIVILARTYEDGLSFRRARRDLGGARVVSASAPAATADGIPVREIVVVPGADAGRCFPLVYRLLQRSLEKTA